MEPRDRSTAPDATRNNAVGKQRHLDRSTAASSSSSTRTPPPTRCVTPGGTASAGTSRRSTRRCNGRTTWRDHRRPPAGHPAPAVLRERHDPHPASRLVGRTRGTSEDGEAPPRPCRRPTPSSTAKQYGSTVHVLYKTSAADARARLVRTASGTPRPSTAPAASAATPATAVGDYVIAASPTAASSTPSTGTRRASSLRHAWLNGSNWSFETARRHRRHIPATPTTPWARTSPRMPYGGGLHVVYQDARSGVPSASRLVRRRRLARRGARRRRLGLSPGRLEQHQHRAVNAVSVYGGQLHVTYFDHANGDALRHAWYELTPAHPTCASDDTTPGPARGRVASGPAPERVDGRRVCSPVPRV